MLSHEKRLKLSFAALDHNKDGVIDEHEIITAFRKLGVHIENSEAKRLIKRYELTCVYETKAERCFGVESKVLEMHVCA